jgi:alpha-amylase
LLTGYDVYDLYDLGEFEQKGAKRTGWGTKEEFLDLIKHGKELGIISYMSVIICHILTPSFR